MGRLATEILGYNDVNNSDDGKNLLLSPIALAMQKMDTADGDLDPGLSEGEANPSESGLSAIQLNFLVVGILFLATVILGSIYFFLQYGGMQMCRKTLAGFSYNGPERGGISSVSGGMSRGNQSGGASKPKRGIKMQAALHK